MTTITIRQSADFDQSPNATVSFDHQGSGYPVTIQNPFTEKEETQLAWYFEEHLKFPFTHEKRAERAGASIRNYGESLFQQLFPNGEAVTNRYREAIRNGTHTLYFEIVGSATLQSLHWEALRDPAQPRPFVLNAPMVRTRDEPLTHRITPQLSPTINVLVVTARPSGGRDVGFRTISQPLVETLRKAALPVQVDIVRPGTYRALVEHLRRMRDQQGVGFYHIIHFDLHGAVLSYAELKAMEKRENHPNPITYRVLLEDRFARPNINTPAGDQADSKRAYLFFEGEETNDFDPAEAGEVADLLHEHQIPIAILNACQSGHPTGMGDATEASLGNRLLDAGVQTVLAMGYSVSVSAAVQLMATFYDQLFKPPHDLLTAIRYGREALYHEKKRRAYFNQQINLEDWLLPVVYQPGGDTLTSLPLREPSFEEEITFLANEQDQYNPPQPRYGFVGRDVDILQIEKRLLQGEADQQRNLLLLRGMGGAGKTTLLHHLAWWWQTTGFVGEIFYFGYDEKAYTLAQLLDGIARQLLNREIPYGATMSREFSVFQAATLSVQQGMLARKLRSQRHLLILDNLESVTGDPLAIQNTLDSQAQQAIRDFLAQLLGGESLVLLGSRGRTEWLTRGTNPPLRPHDIYDLPGLDPEAASALAERILSRHVTDPQRRQDYRESEALQRLLKLLDGYPLPLEVVLSNLARQSPNEILTALQEADPSINESFDNPVVDETDEHQQRTRTLLGNIGYSYRNLDEDGQRLLLCLFPFRGVFWADQAEGYVKHLQDQPSLADLPFDRFEAVLQLAQDWGLLTSHELPSFLKIQPVFPYFLKMKLVEQEVDLQGAIETGFWLHYDDLGGALDKLLNSKDAQEKQIGAVVSQVEYENLTLALGIVLENQESHHNIYWCLANYLDTTQDHSRHLQLGQLVQKKIEQIDNDDLTDERSIKLAPVLGDIGNQLLQLQKYQDARSAYEQSIELANRIDVKSLEIQTSLIAIVYHNLGIVAQKQRKFAQAQSYYHKALDIKIEFNDRYGAASIYHQLGMVAQEQREFTQAQSYYHKALDIKIEFNDRYGAASIYHQLGMVAQEQRELT